VHNAKRANAKYLLSLLLLSFGVTLMNLSATKKPSNFSVTGLFGLNSGSSNWARTSDLRINSPALYQLSYRGTAKIITGFLVLFG